jgi:hypothetical protein
MLRWRGAREGRKGPLFEKSGAKTFTFGRRLRGAASSRPGLRAPSRDDIDIFML